MKGWMVGNDGIGYVWVRAETRHAARRYYPGSPFDGFAAKRVLRQPWLDGSGPEREIQTVEIPCPDEDHERCGCSEGYVLSEELTLVKLEREAVKS
jgi:hypothetical protein